MSNLPGRDEYLNEYFTKREYGDFTPFYVTITICSVIAAAIIVLNIIFCCCSQYKDYWLDNNTGNRYLIPIWTRTPHKHAPLDYSELEGKAPPPPLPQTHNFDYPEPPSHSSASTAAYSEREHRPQFFGSGVSKRESDI